MFDSNYHAGISHSIPNQTIEKRTTNHSTRKEGGIFLYYSWGQPHPLYRIRSKGDGQLYN